MMTDKDREFLEQLRARGIDVPALEEKEQQEESFSRMFAGIGQDIQKNRNRFDEICKADKENRLLILPCPMGAEIWMITERRYSVGRPYYPFVKQTKLTWSNAERVIKVFGRTVFLDRMEAAKALERMLKNGTTR